MAPFVVAVVSDDDSVGVRRLAGNTHMQHFEQDAAGFKFELLAVNCCCDLNIKFERTLSTDRPMAMHVCQLAVSSPCS